MNGTRWDWIPPDMGCWSAAAPIFFILEEKSILQNSKVLYVRVLVRVCGVCVCKCV